MQNQTVPETAIRKLLVWQALQLVVLLALITLLYKYEKGLLPLFYGGEHNNEFVTNDQILLSNQLPGLPGKLWKAFPVLLIISLALMCLDRLRHYALALAGLGFALLMIGDRIYFQFFTSLLSWQSLDASHQTWAIKNSIISELEPHDGYLLLGVLLVGVFGYFYNRALNPGFKTNPKAFVADRILGLLMLIVAFHCGLNAFEIPIATRSSHLQSNENGTKFELAAHVTSSVSFAVQFGLFNYHLDNLFAVMTRGAEPIQPDEHELIEKTLERSHLSNLNAGPLDGLAKGKNVIVISMEAFQHFVLGLSVDGQELTPTLNQLKQHALHWDNIIDNIAVGGTSDAEFSVLTGLLPNRENISAMTMPTDPPPQSLPETLAGLGYHTLSLHGFVPSFWNRSVNHPALGFKEMLFQKSFTFTRKGLGVPDDTFFDQSARMLHERPQPFFAFLISLSSHHPYLMPREDQRLRLNMSPSKAYDYFQAVHFADAALGIFFKQLAEQNLLDNSLFVIYGDHAAPMDRFSAKLIADKTGIDPLATRQKRVPLLIYCPSLEHEFTQNKSQFEQVVGGLQDVFPTIMHLIGHPVPFGVYGTHLMQADTTRPVMPFYKQLTGFVHQGWLFTSQNRAPFADSEGNLYHPGEPDNNFAYEERFREAAEVLITHSLIFHKRPNFRNPDWGPSSH